LKRDREMLWGGRRDFLPGSQEVKWRAVTLPTTYCCTLATASAQPLEGKGAPNLIEPRAVRAAVKTASRLTVALRPFLTPSARGAVHHLRPGRRNGPQPNKETASCHVVSQRGAQRTNPLVTHRAIKERRTAFPAPKQRTQNNRLDRKSPIQVRSPLSPAASLLRT
jgi:hypothetical protein